MTGGGRVGARAYFADVRRAARRIEELTREIGALLDGDVPMTASTVTVRGGDQSDPTASAAFKAAELLADARAERDACIEMVGEALQVIDGLRRCFSRKADVVERYYVDGVEWDEVAEGLGIARRTALTWRDEMMAWLDEHPRAYVVGCRFLDFSQADTIALENLQ